MLVCETDMQIIDRKLKVSFMLESSDCPNFKNNLGSLLMQKGGHNCGVSYVLLSCALAHLQWIIDLTENGGQKWNLPKYNAWNSKNKLNNGQKSAIWTTKHQDKGVRREGQHSLNSVSPTV